jgi:hypothetical protein
MDIHFYEQSVFALLKTCRIGDLTKYSVLDGALSGDKDLLRLLTKRGPDVNASIRVRIPDFVPENDELSLGRSF